MTDKLPTKAQFEKAVSDPAAVKTLLLQILDYGTAYSQGSKSALDEKRTAQTSKLLTQLWTSFPEQLEGVLVDILWYVQCAIADGEEKKKALHEIVAALLTVPEREAFWKELQGTLDPTLLESVQLLPTGDKMLIKRIRKINTELYYRQQKYNLLQEESEGYAKLLTLLFNNNNLSDVTPETLRMYMGTFDLDPNRVLDLLLDLLESSSDSGDINNQDKILQLMQDFSIIKIPQLLTFKLTCYQKDGKAVPSSLYSTIVLLAKKQLLDLASLVPTAITDLHACYAKYTTFLKLRITRLGRISLNTDNRPDAKMQESQRALEESSKQLAEQNAMVGLLHVLLESNEWDLASMLLIDPDDWCKICTLLPIKVGQPLCNVVSNRLMHVYESHVKMPILVKVNGETKENAKENGDAMMTDEISLEDLLAPYSAALLALGQSGCLSTKPVLYCKLCRLLRSMLLKGKATESLSPSIYELLKSVMVATLSLFAPNPAISGELWSLLSILPYSTRYQLYRDWAGGGLERAGMGSKPLLQIQCEMEAGKSARYTLKRLSKDNVRDMGRQVSKVTHSNPLVVFATILGQIESYDNLIQMMVETVRFVTPLSLDVLGYCVLSRLSGTTVGGANRSRLKDDGINLSQWLQSLEAFTGAFIKKCPDVEFRGILSYLVHRLKDGHVLELGVLKTLLKTAGSFSFADYSPAASLSEQQLEGQAGSLILKRETFAFGIVESFNFRASARVKSVLQSNNLGVTLLILLAQTRSRLLFEAAGLKKKDVKLIANLLDTCQVVMYILLEFITDSTVSEIAKDAGEASKVTAPNAIKTYAESLPPLEELFNTYKLDSVSAWMLCRPIFQAMLAEEKKGDQFKLHEGDRKKVVRQMLPEEAWKDITPTLFDKFFSFSLYDIYFPESCYERELTRLKDSDQRLAHKKNHNQPGVLGMDFSQEDAETWQRVKATIDSLAEDMEKQKKHCKSIRRMITSSLKDLLPSKDISVSSMQTFITHCIYPRCRLSPEDATYCVHFVMTLHQIKTPGFSTMHFIDEFIKVISGSLFSSTEDEAAAMGVLLLEFWKVISNWRYDENAFKNEVEGSPGSAFVKEGGPLLVSFEDYKELYNSWHATIGQAMIGCLDSTEYMHVRSCFVILSRIVDAFPTRPKLGQKLFSALEPLQDETYPLPDIMTAAQAYGTLLIKARTNGVWKEEDAATIKAREEKEKANIAEKKKRREEQHAQMKRDTEKLNEEIGEGDSRDRGRRGGPPADSRRPNFEPRGGTTQPREPAKPTNVARGGSENGGRRGTSDTDHNSSRNKDQSQGGQQPSGSLQGRWERGGGQAGDRKRDRSPNGGDDQPSNTKRPRMEGRPAQSGAANFEPARGAQRSGGGGPQGQQQRGDRGGGGGGGGRRGPQRR